MLSSVLSGYHLESTIFTYLEGAIWQFRYSVFECRGRHLLLGGVCYLCKRQGNFKHFYRRIVISCAFGSFTRIPGCTLKRGCYTYSVFFH